MSCSTIAVKKHNQHSCSGFLSHYVQLLVLYRTSKDCSQCKWHVWCSNLMTPCGKVQENFPKSGSKTIFLEPWSHLKDSVQYSPDNLAEVCVVNLHKLYLSMHIPIFTSAVSSHSLNSLLSKYDGCRVCSYEWMRFPF